MELIAFVAVSVSAYLVLVSRQRAVVYGWFVLFVVYSLTVRLLPPTLDMVTYSNAVTTWPPPLTLYTLREPLIWLGAPLLQKVVGNRVLTFVIVDVVSAAIVIRAMDMLDTGDGRMLSLAPTIVVSYVFLLGQQNGWRQQVAFVILIWSCAARAHSQPRAFPLFVLALLAHNSTALLLGYWFDLGRTKGLRYGPLVTFSSVILIFLLLPYLRKSSSLTGLHTEYLYVAVAMALGLVMLYANMGSLPRGTASAFLNFVAFIPAIGILGSTQFERMGMMFLVLMLVDMFRHHRVLRIGGAEVSNLVYATLVVPVFLFPNALGMLLM